MFTRRFVLCGLLVLLTVGSTGCCGRLRNAVYRWRHCQGWCAPSFEAPGCCDAPAYGGPAYGGPAYAAPGPGCATCFAAPEPVHAIPVSAPASVQAPIPVGTPVFGAPLPAPTPYGPPTVTQTPEPPMAKPGEKR